MQQRICSRSRRRRVASRYRSELAKLRKSRTTWYVEILRSLVVYELIGTEWYGTVRTVLYRMTTLHRGSVI
jgi:hypothetical protein